MAQLKKILANEAFTFILSVFAFMLACFVVSHDLETLQKGLEICAALWGGVGLAVLAILLEEKRIEQRPGVVRALGVMLAAVLFGPFAAYSSFVLRSRS